MNATQKFIEYAVSKGFSADEAAQILAVYKKARVIKFDKFMPQFVVTHGAFLDADVMRNALKGV